MTILIIGAGNGGLAVGSKLIERGMDVNLYDNFDDVIQPIQDNDNRITMISGGSKKDFQFNMVTTNLEKALEDVDYIFAVVPAFAHAPLARELSDHIADNQVIILQPGRTGGALEFKRIFDERGKANIIAETETMIFACRKNSPIEINIYGTKRSVGMAAVPSEESEAIVKAVNQFLPFFHSVGMVLSTSLRNIGAIFHPAPFLFNLSRIDSKEQFKYYHEGISPSIATLLESLDAERLAIARKFDVEVMSAREWVNFNYGVDGETLYEAIQMNDSYRDIYAPTDIHSRYVLEDVPMSLVPMRDLAEFAKIETPVMDAIITIASNIYGNDFRRNGRRIVKSDLMHT